MWDIISSHHRLTEFLRKGGVESPRIVSEILLAHVLEIPRIQIYSHFDTAVPEDKLKEVNALVKQVVNGVPLQLIVGDAHFLSNRLFVERGVFIPRPETETLVDTAVKLLGAAKDAKLEILDIGVGSGTIALSLLKLLPAARAVGTDINETALRLAAHNAESLGVADRFTAKKGSLFEPVRDMQGNFDLVISNPPYIPSADIEDLDRVVKDHDPREALDGGADGLDIVRSIVREAPEYLKQGGLLAFEVGAVQARNVAALLENSGFKDVSVEKDLFGLDRCVFAWKK